ncbi:phosphotransferase family enzyme [Actinophytocola oryzae]|uniref:Phosphotransferase family enzyme n=1 Tax=Actinophytocola oryzae TaxID=502181 RepID=A0A4V3FV45_9PSEU|nr:phosphotransferase family enzyme [Actinophytocola oryzae]
MHELLTHLAHVGFDGAPRFLGVDEHGREMLGFVEGEVTVDGPPRGVYTDAALTAAARLLRGLHDATTEFAAAHPLGWRFQVGAPTTGPVICHNDLGPYNTVYRSGRPAAFIDWDFAAPAPREWDVAYALWRFVPLYDDVTAARLGWPTAPRGPRIARFLDAYGLDDRADILAVLHRRQQVIRDTIQTWAEEGDPAFVGLRREGRLAEIDDDITYARRKHREWKAFLT